MQNSSQIEYWNGQAGHNWATQAEQLDRMLSEFCRQLVEKVAEKDTLDSVLDIGCGAGAVSLTIARSMPDCEGIYGIDISEPLLEVARLRAKKANLPVRFLQADASSHLFDSPVQTMVSRFGVMFFEDPVLAFDNLRRSVTANGRLIFTCWQSIKLNAWASAPLRAAIPLLKEPLPAPDPLAPGPFAFADKDRVSSILSNAGWSKINIESIDTQLQLPGTTVDESAKFMMTLGPLARVLSEQGLEEAPVKAALTELLSNHKGVNDEIWMDASCWLVSCQQN